MRRFLIAALLLGATAAATAQSNSSAPPQAPVDENVQASLPAQQISAGDQDPHDTCFTMRSYIFARNDGKAPRLVGMTSCTSVRRSPFYHAGQPAKFGLYPATVNTAPEQPPSAPARR